MTNAPDIPRERFSALTRLDHNRAISQLAKKTGAAVTDIKKVTIWGNHSATQYPDIFHAEIKGKNAVEVVNDQSWIENDFIPTVAKRGAAIIDARARRRRPRPRRRPSMRPGTGCSAPPRATGLDGGRFRRFLRRPGGFDLIVPVTTKGGDWSIVQGLEIDKFSRARIDKSTAELAEERDAVTELKLI